MLNSKKQIINILNAIKIPLKVITATTIISLITIGARIPNAIAAETVSETKILSETEIEKLLDTENANDDVKESKAKIHLGIETGRIQLSREAREYAEGYFTKFFDQNPGFRRGRARFQETIQYPEDPRQIALSELKSDPHHQKILKDLRRANLPDEEKLLGQTQEEADLKNGEGLQKNNLSRNHRLADSSIKSILVTSGSRLFHEKDTDKSKAIKNGMREFAEAVGGEEALEKMDKLLEEIEKAKKQGRKPKAGFYQKAHQAISASPKNLRIGDATKNQQADNTFDANRTKDGRITLRSNEIMLSVLKLANQGAISKDLALAATTPATYKDENGKDTKIPVSSSTPDDSVPALTAEQQAELEKQRKNFRSRTTPSPPTTGTPPRRSGTGSDGAGATGNSKKRIGGGTGTDRNPRPRSLPRRR